MSTSTTPFMLVYGPEAVLPVEIELPSLRITAAANLSPDDKQYVRNRIAVLEALVFLALFLRVFLPVVLPFHDPWAHLGSLDVLHIPLVA